MRFARKVSIVSLARLDSDLQRAKVVRKTH
jgi:hypothetical protein